MTENEAIEELKYDCNEIGKAIPCDTSWGESFENAYAMAINALEESKQYRTIGTVEECRAAVEKQTAKRPRIMGNAMICPSCPRCFKSASPTYCPSCGQKLKWEDEE